MNYQQPRPFAVVTGASSGIGFELAKVSAEERFDLLITAEEEELEAAQRELNQLTAGVECAREDLGVLLYLSQEGRGIGLLNELRAYKLQEKGADTVTSLMPGPTETEFFGRAEMFDTPVGEEENDDPAAVARQGYEALMAGEEEVVGGSFKNKAQTVVGKVVPDAVKAEMHRKMAQPAMAGEKEER